MVLHHLGHYSRAVGNPQASSPKIMYHFLIEFLELAVSCLGLGEGGCDCTALALSFPPKLVPRILLKLS